MKSNIGYRTQNIEYSLMTNMIEVMSASETTESLWPLLGPKDSKTSQNIKTAKITIMP